MTSIFYIMSPHSLLLDVWVVTSMAGSHIIILVLMLFIINVVNFMSWIMIMSAFNSA